MATCLTYSTKKAIQEGLFYLDTRARQENLRYEHSTESNIPKFFRKTNGSVLGLDSYKIASDKDKKYSGTLELTKPNDKKSVRYLDIDWKNIRKNTISAIPHLGRQCPNCNVDLNFISLDYTSDSKHENNQSQTEKRLVWIREKLSSIDTDLRKDSKNVKLWLKYIEMQGELIELTYKDSSSIKLELSLIEIQISICERALQFNPESITMQEKYMSLCSKILGNAEITNKWDLLLEKSWHPMLELGRLNYIQGTFTTFIVTEMTAIFVETLSKMEKYKNIYADLQKLTDRIQINVILRLVSFYLESGYTERSVALFQGFIEWNFCKPEHLSSSTYNSLLKSFEEYWDFSKFKIGDQACSCWANYAILEDDETLGTLSTVSNGKIAAFTKKKNSSNEQIGLCTESTEKSMISDWLSKETSASDKNIKPSFMVDESSPKSPNSSDETDYSTDPFRFVLFEDILPICVGSFALTPFETIQILCSLFRIFGVQLPPITITTKISDLNKSLNDEFDQTKGVYVFDFTSDPYLDSPGGLWSSLRKQDAMEDAFVPKRAEKLSKNIYGQSNVPSDHIFGSKDGRSQHNENLKNDLANYEDALLPEKLLNLTLLNCPTFKTLIGAMVGYDSLCTDDISKARSSELPVPFVGKWMYNPVLGISKNNVFTKLIAKIIFQLLSLNSIGAEVKEWLSLCYIMLESRESYKGGRKASKRILKLQPDSWIVWDLYANIEAGYGNYDEAIKIWHGALYRLANDTVDKQSFSVIIWLNLIMLYIRLGDIESVKKSLVVMHFPRLWNILVEGKEVELSSQLEKVSQMMKKKYIQWAPEFNPAEWYSGLIVSSIYCYYYQDGAHSGTLVLDNDLKGAEQRLKDALSDLEYQGIISSKPGQGDAEDQKATSLNVIRTTLHELIISQLASLNYFHNVTNKTGHQPRNLRQVLVDGIHVYPENSCLWELLLKTESKTWAHNIIENVSQRLLTTSPSFKAKQIVLQVQIANSFLNGSFADSSSKLEYWFNRMSGDLHTSKSIRLWIYYIHYLRYNTIKYLDVNMTTSEKKLVKKWSTASEKATSVFKGAVRQAPWSKGLLLTGLKLVLDGIETIDHKEIFSILVEKDFRLWNPADEFLD